MYREVNIFYIAGKYIMMYLSKEVIIDLLPSILGRYISFKEVHQNIDTLNGGGCVRLPIEYISWNKFEQCRFKKAPLGFEPRISCLLDRRFAN